MNNSFDVGVLIWLNQFVHRSYTLDAGLVFLSGFDLVKGYAFMVALWWLWFVPEPARARNRGIILGTLAASFTGIIAGRILAHLLPFRVRPLFDPALGLTEPFAIGNYVKIRTWSSFPSDHAIMFSALATGICLISRRLGALAFVYGAAVIGLPRLYLGFHYPTDILGGTILGTAFTLAATGREARPVAERVLKWQAQNESTFYAVLFFATIQISTMFEQPREIFHALGRLVR
jgi:membrane-associated phospholipid phosphatase